jgi:hypothetical protein
MNKVAIFGVPRSGTSWLSQIFNSHPDVCMRHQPLFSYGHKGKLNQMSTQMEIYSFFEDIYNTSDDFVLSVSEVQKGIYPVFIKSKIESHIIFKETRYLHIIENVLLKCPDIKIIGIVRNPLAVIASWFKAPKEFCSQWKILDEWRFAQNKNQNKPEEFFGFEKWKEATENFLQFEKTYPNQFKLVRYDSLNHKSCKTTEELFKFCGLSFNKQVDNFIKDSKSIHSEDPYSVFRSQGDVNKWNDILPSDIVKEVKKELKNSRLQIFLDENFNA